MAALRVVSPPSSSPKQRREAAEALHEASEEFLECRDLHHPWEVVGCFYVGSQVHRRLLCTRCGTEATDKWTGKGERIQRAYKYVQGYQVKGVRITPIDVRREVLQRVEVFQTEEDLLESLFTKRGTRRKRA